MSTHLLKIRTFACRAVHGNPSHWNPLRVSSLHLINHVCSQRSAWLLSDTTAQRAGYCTNGGRACSRATRGVQPGLAMSIFRIQTGAVRQFHATNNSDLYGMLDVTRSATAAEIKKAYYKKAKECHPDLHPNDSTASQKFRELSEAYSVLSDVGKRSSYDAGGFKPFGTGSSTGFQGTQTRGNTYTDMDARNDFESLFKDAEIVGEFLKTYVAGAGSDISGVASATASGNLEEAGSIIKGRPYLFASLIPIAMIFRFPQLILAAGAPLLRVVLQILARNPSETMELGSYLWREIVKLAGEETKREKARLKKKIDSSSPSSRRKRRF